MAAPIIFNGSDSKLLTVANLKDNAGTIYPKTGEKNYCVQPSNATGWGASGAGITVATTTTAANLPRPETSKTGLLLTGVSGSTAYAYYRFILDDADAGKKLKVQFDMKPGTAVASDFKIDVYSNTASDYTTGNTRLSLSTDASSVTALPALTGTYRTTFDAPTVSAKYIEVRIGMNATHTRTMTISDFIVGPGVVTQGAAVGPWTSYTPTISGCGTVTSLVARYRRVGESIEMMVAWVSGTVAATAIKVSLPTGLTANVSVDTVLAGQFGTEYNGAYAQLFPIVLASDLSNVQFGHNNGRSFNNPFPGNGTGNNGKIVMTALIPVTEWIGSGAVNVVQNDNMYAFNSGGLTAVNSTDTTNYGYGPAGTPVLAYSGVLGSTQYCGYRVTLPQAISATSKPVLEFSADRVTWVDAAALGLTLNYASANTGTQIVAVDSTHVDVRFYAYATPAGGTTSWTSYSTYYWRVRVTNSGQAVGFGAADTTSSGLLTNSRQNVTGVHGFLGGVYSVSNVRASEGSGTTTLTDSDNRQQTFTLTAARTVVLPSASVKAGEVWEIENKGAFDLTLQSSGANTIETIAVGRVVVRALIDTPTTAGNWSVVSVYETGTNTLTLSGCTTTPTSAATYVRNGTQVTMNIPDVTGTSNTTGATLTGLKARLQTVTTGVRMFTAVIRNSGTTGIGIIYIDAPGHDYFTMSPDGAGSNFGNTLNKGLYQGACLTWNI